MGPERELTQAERELVTFLLASKNDTRAVIGLVHAMDDGGMGSLLFAGPKGRLYGGTLAEAEFHDDDGTPVIAAINLDKDGELFELDVWKVDFSPLIRIPSTDQMMIRE
jgi:hypothetical protein